MVYESLDLLYRDFSRDTFAETLGLIVSCSRHSLFKSTDDRGLYHLVEVKALPDLASAKISVSHEVLPGLESSAQVIPVNDRLKVACFDSGSVVPIKNFGLHKTFHLDVRARLSHHSGQISCLAANSAGAKIASGCTAGEITLYQVCDDDIRFVSRTADTNASFITAMSFIKPTPEFSFTPKKADGSLPDLCQDDSLLIYATNSGRVCLLDARCNLADDIQGQVMFNTEPRVSLTSVANINSKPGHLFFLGGSRGEVLACDLRKSGQYVYEHRRTATDGTVRRMKEILVLEGPSAKSFLAYSNSTNQLQILDLDTMESHAGWTLDRQPDGCIRDLIQVRDRIITCGDRCSIGAWKWNHET